MLCLTIGDVATRPKCGKKHEEMVARPRQQAESEERTSEQNSASRPSRTVTTEQTCKARPTHEVRISKSGSSAREELLSLRGKNSPGPKGVPRSLDPGPIYTYIMYNVHTYIYIYIYTHTYKHICLLDRVSHSARIGRARHGHVASLDLLISEIEPPNPN